jgi:hypothetical protein
MKILENLMKPSNPGYKSVLRDKKTGQFVSRSRRKRSAARAKRLKIAAEKRAECGKSAVKSRVSAGARTGVVRDLVGLRIIEGSLVDRIIAAGVAELMRRVLSVDAKNQEKTGFI